MRRPSPVHAETGQADVLRLFVGRDAELAQWEAALGLAVPTIVHVTGPGGIGKSSLLRVFGERARAAGLVVNELDARTVDPSIPAVRAALDAAGLSPTGARMALLLDTYEQLAGCDFFVRAEVLRRAGPHVVAIAGRGQPDAGWFANNGWGVRVVHMPIANLDDRETRRYLELRGLVGERSESVRTFCQGHPLALALAVESADGARARGVDLAGAAPTTTSPGDDPDVVGALFQQFVGDVLDDSSRASLEACSVIRSLREDLLADFVGEAAAARAFPWLRGLSFVERSRNGIHLHDVARSVILRDLRWRNPSRFEELFTRARHVLADRGEKAPMTDVMQKVDDIHFFMRLAPELRDHVEPRATVQRALDVAEVGDASHIESILRLHEGESSVETFRRWFPEQRERFLVVRSPDDPVLGFSATLRLDERAENEPDPRLRAVWRHARRLLGSRRGDVLYTPFWMSREGYQRVDETRLALGAGVARWLFEPGPLALAYAHSPNTEADVAGFERTGARHLRELAFQQADVGQAVFLYDRRDLTPLEWYVRCLRSMDVEPQRPSAVDDTPTLLDRAGFDAEVRAAFRVLHDPTQLKKSPLMDARFLGAAPPGRGARAAALRAAIVARVEALRVGPQGLRQHAALHATFIDPAENQELAAERCRMSYGTFRRYLTAGVARVVDELWGLETGDTP